MANMKQHRPVLAVLLLVLAVAVPLVSPLRQLAGSTSERELYPVLQRLVDGSQVQVNEGGMTTHVGFVLLGAGTDKGFTVPSASYKGVNSEAAGTGGGEGAAHKKLLPLDVRDVFTILILVVSLSLAGGAGIGGGSRPLDHVVLLLAHNLHAAPRVRPC